MISKLALTKTTTSNKRGRRVYTDNKARETLAQYMARCPISPNKIIYEPFKGKVFFKTKYNAYFAYFKENPAEPFRYVLCRLCILTSCSSKVYDAVEFINIEIFFPVLAGDRVGYVLKRKKCA
jgi:hypothetical protein